VIGMTKPPLLESPVRTPAELTARWAAILQEPTFGLRSLWLVWLDDGYQVPLVMPIDEIPRRPQREMLANLEQMVTMVAETEVIGSAHLAVALCRPGAPEVDADDVSWAEALREALAPFDGTWSLHLAAGGEVTPMIDLPS
jgi:hypothetical protein